MPKRRASRRGSQVSPSRKSMSQRETSTGQSTSPSRKRLSQIQTDAMSHIVACPQTKRSPNPVQHHVPEKSLIYAARMQFMKESPHASPQSSQTQIVYSVQRPQAFMTRAQKAKWRQVEAAKKKNAHPLLRHSTSFSQDSRTHQVASLVLNSKRCSNRILKKENAAFFNFKGDFREECEWEQIRQVGTTFWRNVTSGECQESNPYVADNPISDTGMPTSTLRAVPETFGTCAALYDSEGYTDFIKSYRNTVC